MEIPETAVEEAGEKYRYNVCVNEVVINEVGVGTLVLARILGLLYNYGL